jgi:hypothetical protein
VRPTKPNPHTTAQIALNRNPHRLQNFRHLNSPRRFQENKKSGTLPKRR